MQLLGETQDEDRRCIAELVMHKMQIYCRPDKQPTMMTWVHRRRFSCSQISLSIRRIPSVEQPIHELPRATKTPSPSHESPANVISNLSSSAATPAATNAQNQNNNSRRELPNVPRSSSSSESKTSGANVTQNPFYNPQNSTRSTPAQWMGNIGQTIRRQTSNVIDVSADLLRSFFFEFLSFFQGSDGTNKDESEDTLANLKKTFAGIFGDM